MKILVPTAGSVPAKKKAEYIVHIAKRLGASLIALHILRSEEQTEAQKALAIFSEAGRKEEVNVVRVLEKGDIVSTIVTSAEKEGADLIIMGASEGKVVSEWISAGVMEKAKRPVVVIPHEFKTGASIPS
jgi:nucleotide-binding universal stress UspA family protein